MSGYRYTEQPCPTVCRDRPHVTRCKRLHGHEGACEFEVVRDSRIGNLKPVAGDEYGY